MDIIGSESCGNCKFFKRSISQPEDGLCRARSAQVIMAPVRTGRGLEPHPVAVFPNMAQDDWCGEYISRILQ